MEKSRRNGAEEFAGQALPEMKEALEVALPAATRAVVASTGRGSHDESDLAAGH